jgi:pyruvate dehydrogenase E1 component alpha subunit
MADPAKYRTKEEVQRWMERDPIQILGARMQTLGIANEETLKQVDEEVRAQVKDAVDFAEASPEPDPSSVAEYVYA